MEELQFVVLRDRKELKEKAAQWFHEKWGVPTEAYLECMDAYMNGETEYGWYLCLDGDKIVGGLGVIENDFHDRKDLTPNVCAVYTEEEYRCRGIAGKLLNLAVEDQRAHGVSPLCFDGTADEEENLKHAELYWQNWGKDDGQDPIVEVLVDGEIEVLEIMKEINANLKEA
ncbi:MAG: GNAT family N-acetyltransferase [Lachnospiraceae bacterium]|nr:GNAT family N-acetyltransferase [Lachnospiraceae bacterium]